MHTPELLRWIHIFPEKTSRFAARGDLLRRLGRGDDAIAAYERALELATQEAERSFVARRLNELRPTSPR